MFDGIESEMLLFLSSLWYMLPKLIIKEEEKMIYIWGITTPQIRASNGIPYRKLKDFIFFINASVELPLDKSLILLHFNFTRWISIEYCKMYYKKAKKKCGYSQIHQSSKIGKGWWYGTIKRVSLKPPTIDIYEQKFIKYS